MKIYPVSAIFRSLQGEGHFVGHPMTFVRLAGCAVGACHIRQHCDEAPWQTKHKLTAAEIVREVHDLQKTGVVCITGGEPTDHDLLPLVTQLANNGYRVHIETSGNQLITGYPVEWITVSPKTPFYKQRIGHTLKVVVLPEWSWSEIDTIDSGTNFFHRYLQPLTVNGAPVNLEQVVSMLTSDGNIKDRWSLSMQAHRTWGVP
jgi:7-carboxy-7-deazaguanine synthase